MPASEAGPAIEEKRVGRGLAVADLFNDGNMDVVVEDLDSSPMILRNHGIPGRHWVSFELAGTKSNRLALNARVKIVAGGMTQTDEVHSGGSYLSQNDLRATLRTWHGDEDRQRRSPLALRRRRSYWPAWGPITFMRCSRDMGLWRRTRFGL